MNSFVFLNGNFIEVCYKNFGKEVLEEEPQKYIEGIINSLNMGSSVSGNATIMQGISDADIFAIVNKIVTMNGERLLESMKAGSFDAVTIDSHGSRKINRIKLTYDTLQGILDNCRDVHHGSFITDILMWLLVNVKCYLDNNIKEETCYTTYKVIPTYPVSKYKQLSLDLGISKYESCKDENEEEYNEVTATIFMEHLKIKLFEGNNPAKYLALFESQEDEQYVNGIKNSKTKTDFFDVYELFPEKISAKNLLDSFMIEQWTNAIDSFFVNLKGPISEKNKIVVSPRIKYLRDADSRQFEKYIFPVYSKNMIFNVVEQLNQEALMSDWDCYHLELDESTRELVKHLDDYTGERRIYYNHLQFEMINDFYYSVSECCFFSLLFICSLIVSTKGNAILSPENSETLHVKVLSKMEEILTEMLKRDKVVISRSKLISKIRNAIKENDYSRYKGYWEMEQGIRNEKKRVRILREEEKNKINILENEEGRKCLENLLSCAIFW